MIQIKTRFGFILLTVLMASHTSLVFSAETTLFNRVNLKAQAEQEIPNDQMNVLLATEHEDSNVAGLAQKINLDMKWALDVINNYSTVESHTKNYQTYPIYKDLHKRKNIIGWRGAQQVEIKSEDISALTELVGRLQKKLQVNQMIFSPTTKTRVKFENELIEEAMQAFMARVEIVKKNMPKKNHRIINLNINTKKGYRPSSMHAQVAAVNKMSAPSVKAGKSKITVAVSGSVQYF